MGKRKKFHKAKALPLSIFLENQADAAKSGYTSDDEGNENHAWNAEREHQKQASRKATAKQQIAVLLGEENDYRHNLNAIEYRSRQPLEESMCETRIAQEFSEFCKERQQEARKQENEKKAQTTQFATQQMLHRANIADQETECRITLFNRFSGSLKNNGKPQPQAEKVVTGREKAAQRAKFYEDRAKKENAARPHLFQKPTAPAAKPTTQTNAKKEGGWFRC